MRILTKVIAAVLAVSLLGQNMLFAQETMSDPIPPSLINIQKQAKEDLKVLQSKATLYNYIAGGASIAFIFTLGYALLQREYIKSQEEAAAKAAAENIRLAQENAALKKDQQTNSRILENTRKQNKAIEDELNNTRQMYFQKQVSRQQAEREAARRSTRKLSEISANESAQRLSKSRKTHSSAQQEIQSLKEVSAQTKEMYEAEIAALKQELKEANLFISKIHALGPKSSVDMSKYAALYDAGISKEARAKLLTEMQAETWFKELSKVEQEEILTVMNNLYHTALKGIRKETMIYSTHGILQSYMGKNMSKSTKYILDLAHAFFTRKNVVMVSVILLGTSAYANNIADQQADQAKLKVAKRIDAQFNTFLNAGEEELQALQSNEEAYRVIVQQAAMLNDLAKESPAQLKAIEKQLAEATRRQNLQQATQTSIAR